MYCKLRTRAHGFSLVEVMVVIVIIGLLAAAVTIKVGDYVDKAKLNRAKSDIATIVSAVETFYAEHGRYPSNEEGLAVLPLKNLKDPWGRAFVYNSPGRQEAFEVICLGADGVEGGTPGSPEADIGSWDLESIPAPATGNSTSGSLGTSGSSASSATGASP